MSERIVSTNEDGTLFIRLNTELYEAEAARAASYKFTDKYYVFLKPYDNFELLVIFEPKLNTEPATDVILKEFANELLDQQIRLDLDKRNGPFRDIIAKEAFRPTEQHDKSGM